jgi:two-component system, LytTR family, sensor kinase
MNNFLINILSRRWLMHILFWATVIADGYLGNAKYMQGEVLFKHLLYSVPLHIVQVYFNIFVLYPRLFEKGKIFQYIISLFASAMFIAGIANLLYIDAGILKDTPYRYFFFRQLYVQGLSTGAKFLRAGIYNYFAIKEMQRSQQEAELKLLRSQVNPHFLFNTLNNLYSLTLKQSAQAPETVLKLSEIMRYMTTVSGMQKVSLEKEVEYIRNYVALEKLRLNDDAHIDLQLQGDFEKYTIAPLLLLPFVENAFKHGVETQSANVWLELAISMQGNELYYYSVNSKPDTYIETKERTGTGLNNVKKRLEFLYPQRHQLSVEDKKDRYTIKLLIKL